MNTQKRAPLREAVAREEDIAQRGSRAEVRRKKTHRKAHPACQPDYTTNSDYDLHLNRNICHQESEDLEPGSETNTFHNHCNKQTLAATTNNSDSTELAETATNILSFVMPRRLVYRHCASQGITSVPTSGYLATIAAKRRLKTLRRHLRSDEPTMVSLSFKICLLFWSRAGARFPALQRGAERSKND